MKIDDNFYMDQELMYSYDENEIILIRIFPMLKYKTIIQIWRTRFQRWKQIPNLNLDDMDSNLNFPEQTFI